MTRIIKHFELHWVASERKLLAPFVAKRLVHELKWISVYGLARDPYWMVKTPLVRQLRSDFDQDS